MINEGVYSLSELRKLISEGDEFKAKVGKNVASDDKRNNGKAEKDIKSEVDKVTPSVEKHENADISNNGDFNKSLLDLRFMTEPSDSYKKRVEAQVRGYAGAREMEDHKGDEYGNADFEGNKNFLQAAKERSQQFNDEQNKIANSGLKSRELEKKGLGSEKKTAFDAKGEDKYTVRGDDNKDNANKEQVAKAKETLKEDKVKVLNFKRTRFLNESQILSRVPDEFKTDGNRFIMRDKTNTDYIVECHVDAKFGYKELKVVNKMNKVRMDEEMNRMKGLFGFKSGDDNQVSTVNNRLNENTDNIADMLNKIRTIK